jgi:hypothetical protein
MLLDPWNVFSASFGSVPKPYTAFVTLVDLAIYFALMAKVIHARKIYQIPSPVTDGPEAFLRITRVSASSAEQLVLHLPLLWIASFAMSDLFAASLGAVWALSRVLYARGYYKKAKRRAKGLVIGLVVNGILFAGAMAGVMASF